LKLALVGDIGGTNARFALWKNQQLQSVQVLATADHASPEEAISLYLSGLGLAPGDRFGVPVGGRAGERR
jgi:glucokinase